MIFRLCSNKTDLCNRSLKDREIAAVVRGEFLTEDLRFRVPARISASLFLSALLAESFRY